MSEYTQQDRSHTVSMSDYQAGKPWKASADELDASLKREADEEHWSSGRVGQYTLRLLDQDGSGAFDRLVTLAAIDTLSDDLEGAVLVSVRPRAGEEFGRIESHTVTSDGTIMNGTGGDERGYFVGGTGVGGDEQAAYALQRLEPPKEVELKVAALELP